MAFQGSRGAFKVQGRLYESSFHPKQIVFFFFTSKIKQIKIKIEIHKSGTGGGGGAAFYEFYSQNSVFF